MMSKSFVEDSETCLKNLVMSLEEYVGAKGNTLVDHKKEKNIKRI